MPSTDPFDGRADIGTQGESWVAAALDQDIAIVPKAVWANVAGNINMVGADGHAEVFTVAAGVPIDLRPRKILSANTTATGIILIY